MGIADNFDRKFNKTMRGYKPEEVDAALDALLRHCTDLEDANLEFSVANNDLIDSKAALKEELDTLRSKAAELEKKLAESNEKLAKIEKTYNDYRIKFGEAKDLVLTAKTSAGEILSRAEKNKNLIVKEAENERDRVLSELDTEEAKRRKLIEDLDISYNVFSNRLKKNLTEMLEKVESFNVMPIGEREFRLEADRNDIFSGIKEPPEFENAKSEVSVDIDAAESNGEETLDAEEPEAVNVTEELTNDSLNEYPRETQEYIGTQTPAIMSSDFRDLGGKASEVSEMKNSLGEIAKKVSAKKINTTFIN